MSDIFRGQMQPAQPAWTHDSEVTSSLRRHFAAQRKEADYALDPVGWANDKLGVHLWSIQADITRSVRDHKRTVVASCHGSGKALALDTRLRTPAGYDDLTMEEVGPGMWLLDEQYRPTLVTAVTEVEQRRTLDVHLQRTEDCQPTVLRTSFEHEWMVLTANQQSLITVLCRRHGIRHPDWSYWAHRCQRMESADLLDRSATQVRPIVPCARQLPTLRAQGNSGEIDPGFADLERMFALHGTADDRGRLCLRVTGKGKPREVSRAARRRADPPQELADARKQLTDLGVKTLLACRRHGYSLTYELTVSSDPGPVIRAFAPGGDLELSAADVEAIVLQAWQQRIGRARQGGWRLARVNSGPTESVKCVEVSGSSHLYLAGEHDVPTHNSMIASVISAWWVDVHPPGTAIVVSTAPTYAQVHAILWEEIRKRHKSAKANGTPLPGSITMADNWNLPDGEIVGFGRKPKDKDRHAFQGIHRRYVLVVIDEACGVPEELWTGAEAITTNEGCRILAIGNPDDRDTEFGKAFCDPALAQDWNRISIPAATTPNLTGEQVPPLLNEVLVSKAWCDERKRAWGEDDPRYISKVLAKFPEANEASLFSPVVLARAFEESDRTLGGRPFTLFFGVDVARYGGDLTTVVVFDGLRARVLDSWGGTDTVSSAVRVLTKVADEMADREAVHADIRVDVVGLGAGVVDTLAARRHELELEHLQQGAPPPWFTVREMNGSAAPPKDVGGSVQGYGNARAWWFDQAKHLMRSGGVSIVEHAKLKDELGGIRYEYKNGKLYIESKEDMRRDGRKSPDYADSLVYALAPLHEGLQTGDTVSEDAELIANDAAFEDAEMMRDMTIAPF